MDTAVVVAIIGGVVTLLGFTVSGVFGLVASSADRQDKITEQRIALKDEQIRDCESDLQKARISLEAAVQRADGLQKQVDQANLDLWEARGRLHAAEVALLQLKTDRGEEHHQQPPPPREPG